MLDITNKLTDFWFLSEKQFKKLARGCIPLKVKLFFLFLLEMALIFFFSSQINTWEYWLCFKLCLALSLCTLKKSKLIDK